MKTTTLTPNEADIISEDQLLKRWKCHLQTIRYRTRKGHLPVAVGGKNKKYRMSDVLNIESLNPIRTYRFKSGNRKRRRATSTDSEKPSSWEVFKTLLSRIFR